jgi:hypothetical protein
MPRQNLKPYENGLLQQTSIPPTRHDSLIVLPRNAPRRRIRENKIIKI